MNSKDITPIFKKEATIYLEKKSNAGVHYQTEIFKIRDDGNIEVYPPIDENNIRINFKNGEDITLYYWYEGIRFFCKTMVIEYINNEEVYSIVIPKKMNKDVISRWNKYHINIPIVYLKSGEKDDDVISPNKLFSGVTVSLSGDEAYITTKKKLDNGDLLGVAFKVGDEICVLEAKVVKINISEDASAGFDVILNFYNFSDKDKKHLENILSEYYKKNN